MNELITVTNDKPMLTKDAIEGIIAAKVMADKTKKHYDDIRAALLEEMESKGVKKLETPELIITHKAAYDSEKFDKDRFKLENPEMYDDYTGISHNKSSVVIKVIS